MDRKTRLANVPVEPRPLRLRMDAPTEEVRIEIVPLMDVIFCILTFFILAAVGLSRQQAINIDLPKASTAVAQEQEILMVQLTAYGEVYVGQDLMVSREQFLETLEVRHQDNPNTLMALYASESASYSEVVQVLDILREVGGARVALATLPGDYQQAPVPAPNTDLPGLTPYPGGNPYDPYGTQIPGGSFDPTQPQLPPDGSSVPDLPGLDPSNPQLSPGQSSGEE